MSDLLLPLPGSSVRLPENATGEVSGCSKTKQQGQRCWVHDCMTVLTMCRLWPPPQRCTHSRLAPKTPAPLCLGVCPPAGRGRPEPGDLSAWDCGVHSRGTDGGIPPCAGFPGRRRVGAAAPLCTGHGPGGGAGSGARGRPPGPATGIQPGSLLLRHHGGEGADEAVRRGAACGPAQSWAACLNHAACCAALQKVWNE